MAASVHTRLINMFIGLCRNDPHWPSLLYDLGYAVRMVEQKVRAGPHTAATPDVVVFSGMCSHAVVAECKGAHSIPSHQDAAYRALGTADLHPWIETGSARLGGHTVCYVVGADNYPALAGQTTFPFIVFGGKDVKGHGRFGNADLDKALRTGASLEGSREPTGHYPFTHDDGIPVIAQHVLYGIILLVRSLARSQPLDLGNPDAARQILAAVHPYHSRLSKKHEGEIVRKIRKIVKHLEENGEFVRRAEKLRERGASYEEAKRFMSLCQELADRYESQHRIDDDCWE